MRRALPVSLDTLWLRRTAPPCPEFPEISLRKCHPMSFAFSSHVLRAASSAALRAGRSCGAHTATRARCASAAACPHPAAPPRHSAAAAHAYSCLVHRRSMVARSSPAGGPGQVSGALMESMTAKVRCSPARAPRQSVAWGRCGMGAPCARAPAGLVVTHGARKLTSTVVPPLSYPCCVRVHT